MHLRDLIKTLPKERIQLEVIKAFKGNNTHRFLTMLDEMEMLEYVFPSLMKLKGIDGGSYHKEQTFTHCLNALRALDDCGDYRLKLACLYHDVGKHSPVINNKGFNTFREHNMLGLDLIVHDLKEHLLFSNDVVDYVKYQCLLHMGFHEKDSSSEKAIVKMYSKLLEKNIPLKDWILLRYADRKSNSLNSHNFFTEWKLYRRFLEVINKKVPFRITDLDISGKDIMQLLNIKPSKLVGEVLTELFNLVQEGNLENKFGQLAVYVSDKKLLFIKGI